VEDVAEVLELRKDKGFLLGSCQRAKFESLFLHRQDPLKLVIRDHLHVLMRDACPRVEATVKEHEGIESFLHSQDGLEVKMIKRACLLFKGGGDH